MVRMKTVPVRSIFRRTVGVEVVFSPTDDALALLGASGSAARLIEDRFRHLEGREIWFSGLEGKLLYAHEATLQAVARLAERYGVQRRQVAFVVGSVAAGQEAMRQVARHVRREGYRIVLGEGDPSRLDLRAMTEESRWFDVFRVSVKLLPAPSTDLAQAIRQVLRCYRTLGCCVVANYVDNAAEWSIAKRYGCRCFQGLLWPQGVPRTPAGGSSGGRTALSAIRIGSKACVVRMDPGVGSP